MKLDPKQLQGPRDLGYHGKLMLLPELLLLHLVIIHASCVHAKPVQTPICILTFQHDLEVEIRARGIWDCRTDRYRHFSVLVPQDTHHTALGAAIDHLSYLALQKDMKVVIQVSEFGLAIRTYKINTKLHHCIGLVLRC